MFEGHRKSDWFIGKIGHFQGLLEVIWCTKALPLNPIKSAQGFPNLENTYTAGDGHCFLRKQIWKHIVSQANKGKM